MSAELPLSDVRVLDLTRLLPGGFCSLLLADLGAEVLKVEDTGMGDYIRWAPPYYGDDADQESGTRSALYLALNRGKRSVRLDLKSDPGREALLRLVERYDVVLDGFRPGVLDRLGVGYERMREANPAIVVCAITGYGQDGPNVERAGHDMNYLGLIGLLGLTGAKDGPPVQSGGQIADLGGGALMAAFGVMAALHERRRSGEGQYVDVSMADGALSWLALVAGRYFCDGEVPRRGEQQLAGGLACYMPYEAADGWISCGALEPKFWAAFCDGVERPDLVERQFDPPGSDGWREVAEVFKGRTRDAVEGLQRRARLLHRAGPRHRRGARLGAGPGAGDGGRDGPARLRPGPPARRPDQAQPHPRRPDPGGAGLRRAHRGGPARGRLLRRGGRGDGRVGRGRRARRRLGDDLPRMSGANGDLLRMGELAEASGVPAPTIKHYLREGLLPEPVKTSRNMAYYPPEFVDRIKLIKQLQEERFMPLRAIKAVLDEDPERARAMVELEDRILDRALEGERTRISATEVRESYGVPREVLDRLEKLEVLSPNTRGYSPSDVKIIEAISRFRAGGYDEEIGFTVYDTLRYKSALEDLVREEVGMVMDRLAGEVPPERVVEMLEAGAQPLQDLIAALHTKLMVAELERHRSRR